MTQVVPLAATTAATTPERVSAAEWRTSAKRVAASASAVTAGIAAALLLLHLLAEQIPHLLAGLVIVAG